jgi:glycerol-3-phosphate O-acyltransferase/dihydroxyacetone phosphate acyltransferase
MEYVDGNNINWVITHNDRFGRPITVDSYKDDFFSDVEGLPRAAVKRLTRTIEGSLIEMTINAPDWSVSSVARRELDLY